MKYRPAIDGLRAIAVVPVILFHAGIPLFSGGFVGVDVFFVISGYLITTIILAEKEAGTFCLAGFYERRARRLLPALYVVMICCTPCAGLWMLPDDLENFGQSLVATTLFGNNILLWLTSGYFQLENEFKPLFHTWSLGVEEQFYLGFPLLVISLWQAQRRKIAAALIALSALSLIYAEWASRASPISNYLLLSSRVWELGLGSLLAIAHRGQSRKTPESRLMNEILGGVGLALITYAVFGFDKSTAFPSVLALIPVVGTLLILNSSTPETVVGRALGHKLPVQLGLISYGAYLWHQPIFAFARVLAFTEPGEMTFVMLGVVAFALAYVSWRFVERPFRDPHRVSRRTIAMSAAAGGAVLIVVGMSFHLTSGFLNLWPELTTGDAVYGRRLNKAYNRRVLELLDAPFDQSATPKILVVGNSFARDFVNAGEEAGRFRRGMVSYSLDVPTCIGGGSALNEGFKRRLREADYLIFGSPPSTVTCWKEDFQTLTALGARRIIVVGTKNFGWNMNAVMRLPPAERYSFRAEVLSEVLRENAHLKGTFGDQYYVDILAMISDPDGRVPVFTDTQRMISQDRSHLTRDGAIFVGEKIFSHPLLKDIRPGI